MNQLYTLTNPDMAVQLTRVGADIRFMRPYAAIFYACAAVILLLTTGLTGCSSTPDYTERQPEDRSATASDHPGVSMATTMLGAPYRFGGANPRGFDCSGLVYYSYRKAGIHLPRTTRDQLHQAHKVSLASLRPGDLLFFRLNRKRVSHVAIYIGKDRFIHAPSSGKHVSYGSMSNPYWKKRLVAAGRY